MSFVPAWDTRTGQKLPNEVPKSWLQDPKPFPELTGTDPALSGNNEDGEV